jgi:hypothetical protein
VLGEDAIAVESSFRKTMTIEDEFVRKFKNVSAGRLRYKWFDMERRKATKVCREALGKDISSGMIG